VDPKLRIKKTMGKIKKLCLFSEEISRKSSLLGSLPIFRKLISSLEDSKLLLIPKKKKRKEKTKIEF
jgi:hypothetical protein